MKKLIATSVLALTVLAQNRGTINGQVFVGNSNPYRQLLPYGRWQYCELGLGEKQNCDGFTPGNEQYDLKFKPFNETTTWYAFELRLPRTIDGQVIHTSARAVQRQTAEDGFTHYVFTVGAPVNVDSSELIVEELRNQ